MAIWPDNERQYRAKLLCVEYVVNHAWKYFESPLRSGDWAGIPYEDCMEHLNQYHRNALTKALKNMAEEPARQAYTIDDLLIDLDWNFSPLDIAHLKMVYNPPHINRYEKKRKVHNGS